MSVADHDGEHVGFSMSLSGDAGDGAGTGRTDAASVDAVLDEIESAEAAPAALHLEPVAFFRGVHPLGWLSGVVLVLAILFSTVFDTDFLIGNFSPAYWLLFVVVLALSLKPVALHIVRTTIERASSVTKAVAWTLAWAVFIFQFFNVVTRYGNEYLDQDILYGEVVSLATFSFGLIFLLGINFGVRDGVNPRIDFWWANFRPKTKAWLDFTIHAALLVPFTWMAYRITQPYSAQSLGRKFNGGWPEGVRVWKTWEQAPDAGQLPVGPIKAMILVAFVLFGLQVIAELIKTGFVMMGNAEYGELKESDAPQRIE